MEIHPKTAVNDITLHEDEDQGEMDTVFWLAFVLFTISQICVDWWYPDAADKEAIGKFDIIMTNLWAFFPIMQAQGLFLKSLLLLTCWYSILYHWTDAGFDMPGDHDLYGKLDGMFSTLIIVSYAISWLPKFKTKIPTLNEKRKSCWYKNCRGPPKETSEWRCRWTPNLLLNIGVCSAVFVYMFVTYPDSTLNFVICWLSIAMATVIALYHLKKGKMSVGKKFRLNFLFWAAIGITLGIISFSFKMESDERTPNSYSYHSIWHVYVFSCAYCLSRASEYLEIYPNK